jgi:hypothetical protein
MLGWIILRSRSRSGVVLVDISVFRSPRIFMSSNCISLISGMIGNSQSVTVLSLIARAVVLLKILRCIVVTYQLLRGKVLDKSGSFFAVPTGSIIALDCIPISIMRCIVCVIVLVTNRVISESGAWLREISGSSLKIKRGFQVRPIL